MREVRRPTSVGRAAATEGGLVQFDSARIDQPQLYPFDDVFGARTSTSEL
jgi:hypothetical protein